jgi:hypothetical protein
MAETKRGEAAGWLGESRHRSFLRWWSSRARPTERRGRKNSKRYSLDVNADSSYDAAHLYLTHVRANPGCGFPIPTTSTLFEVVTDGRVLRVPGKRLRKWIETRRRAGRALPNRWSGLPLAPSFCVTYRLGLLGRRRGRFFRSASRLHVILQLGIGRVDGHSTSSLASLSTFMICWRAFSASAPDLVWANCWRSFSASSLAWATCWARFSASLGPQPVDRNTMRATK